MLPNQAATPKTPFIFEEEHTVHKKSKCLDWMKSILFYVYLALPLVTGCIFIVGIIAHHNDFDRLQLVESNIQSLIINITNQKEDSISKNENITASLIADFQDLRRRLNKYQEIDYAFEKNCIDPKANLEIANNNIDSKMGNMSDCCKYCQMNSNCKAYSWTTANGGTCWLKSVSGPMVKKDGVYSSILKNQLHEVYTTDELRARIFQTNDSTHSEVCWMKDDQKRTMAISYIHEALSLHTTKDKSYRDDNEVCKYVENKMNAPSIKNWYCILGEFVYRGVEDNGTVLMIRLENNQIIQIFKKSSTK